MIPAVSATPCKVVSGVVAALIGILAAGRGDAAIKLICTRWRCSRQHGWRGYYRPGHRHTCYTLYCSTTLLTPTVHCAAERIFLIAQKYRQLQEKSQTIILPECEHPK